MLKYAAIATLLAVGSAAQAAIVYDNGGPVNNVGNEATGWIQAEDFSLAEDTHLATAGLFLGGVNWDGNLRWYIHDDAGGMPGDVLATALVNPVSVDTDIGV